jgi:hypothetical protein
MTTTGAEQAAFSVLAFLAESSVRALACAAIAGLALAVLRPRRAAAALCLWTVVLYASLSMPVLDHVLPEIGLPLPALATLAPVAALPAAATALYPLVASVSGDDLGP